MPDALSNKTTLETGQVPRDGIDVFITAMIRRQMKLLHCLLPQQVRRVRYKVGGSQRAFAARFGLSPHTLAQWESGRRTPDRAASALLKVIAFAPEVVEAALNSQPSMVEALRQAAGPEANPESADGDEIKDRRDQKEGQHRRATGFGTF